MFVSLHDSDHEGVVRTFVALSCELWGYRLGRAWASPTLVWLHCTHVCACLLAWTDHLSQVTSGYMCAHILKSREFLTNTKCSHKCTKQIKWCICSGSKPSTYSQTSDHV